MKKLYWGLLIATLVLLCVSIVLTILELELALNIVSVVMLVSAIALLIVYFGFVRFKCPKCNLVFKSKCTDIFFAPHTPTKRRVYCPHCKEWLWCLDVFEKEKKNNE